MTMIIAWEYDGPEWRRLKAVREALGTMGPRGRALQSAMHAIQDGRMTSADGFIEAALLEDSDEIEAAVEAAYNLSGIIEP